MLSCSRYRRSDLLRAVRPLTFAALSLITTTACQDSATEPEQAAVSVPALAVASNSWLTRADLPGDPRLYAQGATVTNPQGQSEFYVFGGLRLRADGSAGATLRLVQAYNAATNTWTSKASSTPLAPNPHRAGVIGGRVYFGGGRSGQETYQTFVMYDPATDAWTNKQKVPVPGWGGVTAVLDGKLYLLATCLYWTGCYVPEYAPPNDMRFFGSYDPATDRWTALTPPPSGQDHQFGVAGAVGGKLYFAGGRHTKSLDIYDPATKQWTSGAPMGSNRAYAAAATVAGKLYVIAGDRLSDDGTGGTAVATTSRYDPATNTWTNLKVSPRGGPGLTAGRVVVNGQPRIELVGGTRSGSNLQYVP